MGKNSIPVKPIPAGAGKNLALQLGIFFQFVNLFKIPKSYFSFQLLDIEFILRSVWSILGNKEMNNFSFMFSRTLVFIEYYKRHYDYYFVVNICIRFKITQEINCCFATQAPWMALFNHVINVTLTQSSVFKEWSMDLRCKVLLFI